MNPNPALLAALAALRQQFGPDALTALVATALLDDGGKACSEADPDPDADDNTSELDCFADDWLNDLNLSVREQLR